MNTKSLRLKVQDEDRGTVSAVFATFNVIDSHGDVTIPGAFEDGAEVVISAYGHTSWEGMLPVGKGRIRQTQREAIFEGRFFLDTTAGRDTFLTVKELGALGQWSYGFDVQRESYGEHDGQRVRFLEKLKTYEVSPVLLGAGVGVRTLAVKHDQLRERLTADQLAVLRKAREHVAEEEARERAVIEQAVLRLAEYTLSEADACVRAIEEDLKNTTWYVTLADPEVAEWKRAVATVAASKYATDLGQPTPVVRWFRGETDTERHYLEWFGEPARKGFGWTSEGRLMGLVKADEPGVIWLNAEMHHAADIDSTAAHEVRHLAGGDERQAQEYEAKARERYWSLEGVK